MYLHMRDILKQYAFSLGRRQRPKKSQNSHFVSLYFFFALVEDISAFETSKALISGCILRIYFYLKYQHYFILGFVGLS
jgi:hypothetical protein